MSMGVTNSTAEYPFQIQAIEDMKNIFGELPQFMLGDGLYTELETVDTLEKQGITVLAPVESVGAIEGDDAYRAEPSEGGSSDCMENLPVNKRTKRFTRKAFVFDTENDCFYCPMGKKLGFSCMTNHKKSSGKTIATRVYKAKKEDCTDCPVRERCIPQSHNYRRVERMNRSEVLDRVAQAMAKSENKERYDRRKVIAESLFAHIKNAMGIRRFLHRGHEKVETEWSWICTAYNISTLVRLLKVPSHPAL